MKNLDQKFAKRGLRWEIAYKLFVIQARDPWEVAPDGEKHKK